MAQTVFILGAGASKQGGAPLMSEFLDAADRALKAGRVATADKEHFERVLRAVGKLQQVHSKHGALDLVNMESVFGAFEMARILGTLPGLDANEIAELVPSMVTVTLERGTVTLVVKGVPARVCANCGEEYVDGPTSERLLRAAEEAARAGVQVDVRQFAAA